MASLSKKEMELLTHFKQREQRFISSKEIDQLVSNRMQRYSIVKSLARKKILIRLSKQKYYLGPLFTREEVHPFVLIDEMCNGLDYFIGKEAAAWHWNLGKKPDLFNVYSVNRQGLVTLLGLTICFHRTTKKRLQKSVVQTVSGHDFFVLSNKETSKWCKSREDKRL